MNSALNVSETDVHPRADWMPNRLIWISSLGTIFEWYDFFLYGAVATLLSQHFFPAGSRSASFLLVLAVFGAGFAVRPLGAVIFGSLGDRMGRKRVFVTTMVLMGLATATIGILPTYTDIGVAASVLLVACRLVQGFALGGEYGGAAIYVAEHAPPQRRGLHTSWIQLSAAMGFLLSLAVTVGVHGVLGKQNWDAWAWRVPFLLAIPMLSVSVYFRLRLQESPVFQQLKARGAESLHPLRESLGTRRNLWRLAIGLFGVAAGQTVIWFTAQFSSLYLLQREGGIDDPSALGLMAVATLIASPSFVLSGWLSDKFGRKRVLITAYALALIMLLPAFMILPRLANPLLSDAVASSPVVISGSACEQRVFDSTPSSPCASAMAFLADNGIPYEIRRTRQVEPTLHVDDGRIVGFDPAIYQEALKRAGYLQTVELTWPRAALILTILVVLIAVAGAAYGPNAAILVELFPARIRYTSLSMSYHIGAGYFGGFLPFVTQYIAIRSGNALIGLVYPMAVLAIACIVCLFGLSNRRPAIDE